MLDRRCYYHKNGSRKSWEYPSDHHRPDISCYDCRKESIRRVKRGEIGFFTLLEIAQHEKGSPDRVIGGVIPAQRVLDALIEVCGEDIGRKKFEELIELLTAPEWDDEGEPIESTPRPLVNFLYGLVGKK